VTCLPQWSRNPVGSGHLDGVFFFCGLSFLLLMSLLATRYRIRQIACDSLSGVPFFLGPSPLSGVL